jgi:hypothetical protein
MAARKKNTDAEDAVLVGLGIALLGLAIGAAVKAQKKAKENDVPYVIEEDGYLYKVYPDGSRKKIKPVPNPRYNVNESRFNFD